MAAVIGASPAERAGLKPNDIVVSIDSVPMTSPGELLSSVRQHQVGESLAVGFERQGERRLVRIELTPRPTNSDILRQEFVGASAPELSALLEVQGSPKPTLRSLRGKVVVLEFWADWCSVCRYVVPTLNQWQDELRPQGVELIGITSSSVGEATRAAFQQGMKYPLASDESGETIKAYKAMAIPMLVVIDQRGTVRDVVVGYSPDRLKELRALIERLIQDG